MKEIKIKLDYSNGPIWQTYYDINNDKWLTGVDVVDKNENLMKLNNEIQEEYSSLYSFDNGGCIFDKKMFEKKKKNFVSSIQSIIKMLNDINDGSYVIIDEETKLLQ